MAAYATLADLYLHGLPAAALAAQPRQVMSVDVSGNILTVPGHGLALNDTLRLSVNGALPSGLSSTTLYYAKPVGGDMLQLAAAADGSAVAFGTVGSGVPYVHEQIEAKLSAMLESWSRHVDQYLTAHATPLDSAPVHVTMLVCRLTARALVVTRGLGNPFYQNAAESLFSQEEADQRLLGKYIAGQPVVGAASTDATPGHADNGARVAVPSNGGPQWW